jgi:tetrahydromethanopterin S-methyltransferase subunit G
MGVVADVRQVLQDLVTPDLKEIKARLDALEKRQNEQHAEVMSAINRIVDYKDVMARLLALESKINNPEQRN